MNIRELFTVREGSGSGVGALADESNKESTSPSLASPASLVTFTGAVGAVTAILVALGATESRFAVFIVTLFVGALIYLIGYNSASTPREHVISVGIALINCCIIAGAVLGIV